MISSLRQNFQSCVTVEAIPRSVERQRSKGVMYARLQICLWTISCGRQTSKAAALAQQQQLQQQQQQQAAAQQAAAAAAQQAATAPQVVVEGVEELAGELQVDDWQPDPNEPRYCLCNQVSYGEMVGCDNRDVSCPLIVALAVSRELCLVINETLAYSHHVVTGLVVVVSSAYRFCFCVDFFLKYIIHVLLATGDSLHTLCISICNTSAAVPESLL